MQLSLSTFESSRNTLDLFSRLAFFTVALTDVILLHCSQYFMTERPYPTFQWKCGARISNSRTSSDGIYFKETGESILFRNPAFGSSRHSNLS
jgi:hypothetical protein